jgi:hypothetical protein
MRLSTARDRQGDRRGDGVAHGARPGRQPARHGGCLLLGRPRARSQRAADRSRAGELGRRPRVRDSGDQRRHDPAASCRALGEERIDLYQLHVADSAPRRSGGRDRLPPTYYRPLGGSKSLDRTRTHPALRAIAADHEATPCEVALAWLAGLSPVIANRSGLSRSAVIRGSWCTRSRHRRSRYRPPRWLKHGS